MEFNMGTPNHPEGVAHWSVKTLMWHKLRMALKAQPRSLRFAIASRVEKYSCA